jgi:diguanylate cyclase (GGDEF)-like protein
VKLFLRRRDSLADGRRIPLMASFGVVSLLLTVLLGLVLDVRIKRSVSERSVGVLTKTTQSAIALTLNTIISGTAYGKDGIAVTPQQQQAELATISSAARALVANSDIVAVIAVLPDGTVIGGVGAPPAASKIPLDPGFRAALGGQTQIETLRADAGVGTPAERALLRRYGDLLLAQEGVRVTAGGPILALVRSYAPLGPTRRQANADTRSIVGLLALGLLVFWLALFRLVLGASRALSRQSKANVHLATHDSLTGLPNRALLRDRTEAAVVASRRSGLHVALILADLDRFKEVNDTLGHPYGDLLLKQIGGRLQEHLRYSDTVARLGGDEFVVMLPDLRSREMAVDMAEKLAAALQEPFVLEGVEVDVGSSIGLATTPDHGDNFDELLQHADVAMYVAKKDGLGVVAYDTLLDSHSPARLSLLTDLRRAIQRPEEFVLHYQPQADLATNHVASVEALVRWQHPIQGLLSPDSFIPLAEGTGIIRQLTWCILRAALEQNRQWADDGLLLRVSVNISARCLLDPGFADKVMQMLAEIGVPAARLELELTETAIMTDPDRALSILEDLASRGIWLSIDDFGTGYSSMAYLKKLPVREIKIDRAFIAEMDVDDSDAAIVRSCLDLARNLNLTVVAEGVETQQVWDNLTALGCPAAQGYFLCRPIPSAELTKWMAGHRPVPTPALAN